jgi:hypothetical protein
MRQFALALRTPNAVCADVTVATIETSSDVAQAKIGNRTAHPLWAAPHTKVCQGRRAIATVAGG